MIGGEETRAIDPGDARQPRWCGDNVVLIGARLEGTTYAGSGLRVLCDDNMGEAQDVEGPAAVT